MFEDMSKCVLQNKKAQLLRAFYSAAYRDRDGDENMSEREYKRFYTKLLKEQRKWFDELGGFEAISSGDGSIDIEEFQHAVDQMMSKIDVDLSKHV